MESQSPLANHLRSATAGELADMLDGLRIDTLDIRKDGRGNPRVTITARRKRHTGCTLAEAIGEMLGMTRSEKGGVRPTAGL